MKSPFGMLLAVGATVAAGLVVTRPLRERRRANVRRLDRGIPAADVAGGVYDERDLHSAIEAYRFFYPAVSAEAIFEGGRQLGIQDGTQLMLLDAGPQHVVFTANSDTPYASGVLDLTRGPYVIDLPGGAFVGLVDDHYQRWVADMGMPGPDAGKGGRYLIVPPGYRGHIPTGYEVAQSATYKALIALRAIPLQGNAAARDALRGVKVYPLVSEGMAPSVATFVDVSDRTFDATPLRWEDNFTYWEKLKEIVDTEPVTEEFRPALGLLATLGIAKGVPFVPDARMRGILERAGRLALDEMRVAAFGSRRPERLVWNDRRWEWVGLVTDSADFEAGGYLDLDARDRWFYQAIIASPAMFRRQVGSGSIYFLSARDEHGAPLDGGKSYRLVVPGPVPAKLFWSVTAYSVATRSQVQTRQNRAALGSLHETLEKNEDGSIDVHFGPKPPPGRLEGQWIQTVPGSEYFLYFRIYGPEEAALDGRWRPDDLRLVTG